MAVRLAITKEGFNVLTESDPKNYIFDADLNHLKTFASGEESIELTADDDDIIGVIHGLGYNPLVIAYFRTTDAPTKWSVCMSDVVGVGAFRKSMNANVTVLVDEDNVYFFVKNKSGSTRTIEIQYEIFYEGD